MTPRSPSRVLASLVVALLAVLGLAACGDDDDVDEAADTTTDTAADAGGDAFLVEAEQICSAIANEWNAALQDFPRAADAQPPAADLSQFASRIAEVVGDTLEELRAMEGDAPEGFDDFVNALEQAHQDLNQASESPETATELFANGDPFGGDARQLAIELGLEDCLPTMATSSGG